MDKGLSAAPMDMRYIRKTFDKRPEATSECLTFLEGIYNSVAETLPDVKDHSLSTSLADTPEQSELEDSYSLKVSLGLDPKPKKLKGPRRFRKGMLVRRDRPQTKEVRYLPPGRMKDYYAQFTAQYGEHQKPASFPTFYRVPR